MNARVIKRSILAFLLTLIFWFLYPALRVCFFLITDPIPDDRSFTLSELAINDASGLNETNHGGIVRLNEDLNQSINILKNSLICLEYFLTWVLNLRFQSRRIGPVFFAHLVFSNDPVFKVSLRLIKQVFFK